MYITYVKIYGFHINHRKLSFTHNNLRTKKKTGYLIVRYFQEYLVHKIDSNIWHTHALWQANTYSFSQYSQKAFSLLLYIYNLNFET